SRFLFHSDGQLELRGCYCRLWLPPMAETEGAPGKDFTEINSDAEQEDAGSDRPGAFEEIKGRKSGPEFLIHHQDLCDHDRAHSRENEVERTQAHTHSERDRAKDGAPKQVALVQLPEEREH